jgi:hypothetical protein
MTVRNLSGRAAALLVVLSLTFGPAALAAPPKSSKTKVRDEVVRVVKRVITWLVPTTTDGDDEDHPIPPIPR